MSDDFGTVSVRRGDRAREIEVLRQHYRAHRDALARLIGDAPTEQLAAEYQRLIGSIDVSLAKLDDLEGRPTAAGQRTLVDTPTPPPPPPPQQPAYEPPPAGTYETAPPVTGAGSRSRVALIVGGGLVVLAIIAVLIMRASGDRRTGATTTSTSIVNETTMTPVSENDTTNQPSTTAATNPAPAAASGSIAVTPQVADYGTIRKGTRAVRQFEITNGSASPITVEVARSQCRCLYYDYVAKLKPKGKETLTVTIDGAKAKAGALNENLTVSVKGAAANSATVGVRAEIK